MEEISLNRKKVGYVAIDSASLFIVDPCYLKTWRHGEYPAEDGNSYHNLASFALKDKYGEVERGVVVTYFGGDGVYPVYVLEDNDGNVLKVEIAFDEREDFEDEEEDNTVNTYENSGVNLISYLKEQEKGW
jgi:hypothetical protein